MTRDLQVHREDFYLVDQCPAGYETHTNFADESACLAAGNVQNEVVTIYRSQEVLKMLSLYT
jgi:hypothetical protein